MINGIAPTLARGSKRKRNARPFDIGSHRANEIAALVKFRHEGRLPETDDALIYLLAAAPCLRRKSDGAEDFRFRFENWCIRCGRKPTRSEMDEINAQPFQRLSAADLGACLRLTFDERQAIGIRTIQPCDVTKEELECRRKDRKRHMGQIRAERRRRRRGAKTRRVYLETSLSNRKPWLAEGISRRTWERHRKRDASG